MKSKREREAAESDEKAFDWGIDVPAKKRKRDDAAEPDSTSTEVKKSKKDKKEKKDKKDKKDKHKQESRREKKDKRKDLQDLPEQDDAAEDEEEKAVPEPEVKKEKKSKKEKKTEKAAQEVNGDETESKAEKKDKKKDKKAKKDKKDKPSTTADDGDAPAANGDDTSNPNAIDLSPSTAEKADRHIVFVGNLPFTATAASISAHFASLNPVAVRCMKNKDDDKPCKGFAFVEFGKVWHMRTCLDKFHHSTFEDGVSAGRKINIELTAGGGGKTKQRQDKIRAKNEKLDENRAKRIENEKKSKGAKNAGEGEDKQASNGGIHPSRLARLPGLGQ